jgi:hypothetical protein
MLMITQLHPTAGIEKVKQFRSDLNNINDIKLEIRTELLNAIVFASDDVLESIAIFIDNPNYETFGVVASNMRKDLWGKKTKIANNVITALTPMVPAEK